MHGGKTWTCCFRDARSQALRDALLGSQREEGEEGGAGAGRKAEREQDTPFLIKGETGSRQGREINMEA